MTLRTWIKSRAPVWARAAVRHVRSGDLLSPHARPSFSQEGEDLLLARMFEEQKSGFYVDVGAHHPARFSNTHLLYRRGWRGINIDATPGSMATFRESRPSDINLEVAIASDGSPCRFHLFNDPALNSACAELSAKRDGSTAYSIESTIELPTRPLRDVLADYLPTDIATIDLLTVDVEGRDFDVLLSNDWGRFRPKVVLIEILDASLENLASYPEIALLREHGYQLYSKLVNSVVLVDLRAGDEGP